MQINKIIHGDCEEVLKKFPDDCVDLNFHLSTICRQQDKNVRRSASRQVC